MPAKVAVVGEAVIDRFLEPNGARDVIGGSPLNTAVALRRAGVECDWWGRMSSGTEGEALAAYAEDNSVGGNRVLRTDEPATLVTIELNAAGVPSYGFHLDGASDWGWTTDELSGLKEFSVIQIGSLATVMEPGSSALLETLSALAALENPPLISFDPNARPKAAKDSDDAQRMRNRVEQFVSLSNFIKVSDEDLEWLHPNSDPLNSAAQWSLKGPELVIMTRGSEGAVAFRHGFEVASTPGLHVDVVDTVGAGDTFMAWLLRCIVEEHNLQVPTDAADIAHIMSEAAHAAAITCSRKGCNPPLRAEVLS